MELCLDMPQNMFYKNFEISKILNIYNFKQLYENEEPFLKSWQFVDDMMKL